MSSTLPAHGTPFEAAGGGTEGERVMTQPPPLRPAHSGPLADKLFGWAAKGAAVLCGQGTGRRGLDKSALGRAAATIALNLAAHGLQPATTNGPQAPHLRLAVAGEPVSGASLQPLGPQTRNGVTR